MIKRVLCGIAVLLVCAPVLVDARNTQDTEFSEDARCKYQLNVGAGIFIDEDRAPWIIDFAWLWHFCTYAGVSLGLEVTSEYNNWPYRTRIDGYVAEEHKSDKNVGWILITPAAVLKSPELKLSRDGFYKMWLQAEPGVIIGCPSSNSVTMYLMQRDGAIEYPVDVRKYRNKGLQCVYWNGRVSLNFSIGYFIIGGAYEVSNFDYHSCRRNITLPGGRKYPVANRTFAQSATLFIGLIF